MNENQNLNVEVVEETVFNVPVASITAGNIACDFEAFKKAVKERTNFCKSLVLDEKNEQLIKDTKAGLNNASKQLKSYATSIKKRFLEPYESYEKQIDEINDMITEASEILKVQLDDLKEKLDQEKTTEITNLWNKIRLEKGYIYNDIVSINVLANSRWMNKGYKWEQIESDLRNLMDKVTLQITGIKSIPNYDYLLLDYIKNANFESVMNETLYNSIIVKAHAIKTPTPEVEETKPVATTSTPVETPTQETKEVVLIVKYNCKDQLIKLDQFLKQNGIKYQIMKMKEKN